MKLFYLLYSQKKPYTVYNSSKFNRAFSSKYCQYFTVGSCLHKKITLKGFLHYMQACLLFDKALMHPEAKPEGKTF